MKNETAKRRSRSLSGILLLLLAALLACTFAGCAGDGNVKPDETVTGTAAEGDVTTGAPAGDFPVIRDGQSLVRVIRIDEHSADAGDVKTAMRIRAELEKYASSKVVITTDWTKDGTHDAAVPEILVGNVSYAETAEVASTLHYGDWALKRIGNKIVVLGYTQKSLDKAAQALISAIGASAEKTGEVYSVTLPLETLDQTGTYDATLSAIPVCEGTGAVTYYDAGDGCDELILAGATHEIYDAYIGKLKTNGFTEYTSHTMADNVFTTCYSDRYTLNVGYYGYESGIRIIIEPFSEKTLIGLESDNKYEVVTTSTLTMLGLAFEDTSGTIKNNGLAIIIRLTNGRFVVVDGGFNRASHSTLVVNTLKDLASEYASKTGGVKVAAWIITHPHTDHNGIFMKNYPMLSSNGIKVEKIILNFMSEAELNSSYSTYAANFSDTQSERRAQQNTYTAATALGAQIVVAHVGQVFHIANVKMEMLYTLESIAPSTIHALNTCSLVTKMTFTDEKTGRTGTYMSTGDATGVALALCTKMYGDYLKSDMAQVAHHGGSSWGNDAGTASAYREMLPAVVVWPAGNAGFENTKTATRNAVLINTGTNPNFKEVFVAGWEGSVTTLPLPYTVGTGKQVLTIKS